jgi:hypothetical protein
VTRDVTLRRFERDFLIAGLTLAAGAFVATRGRVDVAIGAAGGGALMAISYLGIKGGADVLAAAARQGRPARRVLVVAAVKFVGRFAVLALVAYGMLAYLRLHPVGILIGALAPVVAAAIQAVRLWRAATRPAKSE